ncbi:hypothetical protein PF008_g10210 [Phytophthora fragariae]|uniref:Uncharacterized protein n=1 Tax=Phytophthora fragariae TaxID=53985 RepID=A0A6G0RVC3_9STRA|nr:hypothetical protein PF008_g10210 [Phytophthora fragariae]
MVSSLLDMRFGDEEVKKRIDAADTNLKKKLAWQFFAGKLSESVKVVLSGKTARLQTGNDDREEDTELWGILNSAFARRAGVGGAILADSDNAVESSDEGMSFVSPESKQKAATPTVSLVDAMKEGMTAVAASLGLEDRLAGVLHELKESQDTSSKAASCLA